MDDGELAYVSCGIIFLFAASRGSIWWYNNRIWEKKKKERKIRIKTALLGRTGLPHKNMFDHRGNSEELRRGQTFVMRGI